MKLKTLSLTTAILFVISIVVFVNENKRGTDILSGSDYIKGFDVGKIQKIVISFKDAKKMTLSRDADQFVLENRKSYPVAGDKINDLIYKIASIQVKKKIASHVSNDDLKKYELDDKSKKYLIEVFDNDGKKTVSFRVGKSEKGEGNYLYREERQDVYLSQNNLRINSSYKDFINTVLLDIKKDDIEQIKLQSDTQIELAKKDKEFVIAYPKRKGFKKEKVQEYVQSFSSLTFDDYYAHTEPDVRTLNFNKDIKIQLKNKLIYKVSLAKKKEDHFLKLNVLVDEIPKKIVLRKDDGKEKLQSIEDIVKAQGDAHRLNREKGNWVYKIDKSVYKKLVKNLKFFL